MSCEQPHHRGVAHIQSVMTRIKPLFQLRGDVSRDYYVALDGQGVRLWVFRERMAPHPWFLQGLFG